MIKKFITALGLFLALILNASAQDESKKFVETGWKMLVGLKEVYVCIEDLPAEALKIGLTEERLKTAIESRLIKAGITVYEKPKIGRPLLYVNVWVAGGAFSIEIALQEHVLIYRLDSPAYATVWSKKLIGTHDMNSEYIMSQFNTLLNTFLLDHAAANIANPKK